MTGNGSHQRRCGDCVRLDGLQAVLHRVASADIEIEHSPTNVSELKPKSVRSQQGPAPTTAHPHESPKTPRIELHRAPLM